MTQIRLRHGVASLWASVNPVLATGEAGVELDTHLMKAGDGVTDWNSLPYVGTSLSTEELEDLVGAMVTGNVEDGGTLVYDDTTGKLNLTVTPHDHTGTYQPADSDLTAIAALTTTAFGRALLALADAAAGRTALGLGTAATAATGDFDAAGVAAAAQAASQPVDSDLTAIAALSTSSFGRSFLTLADKAAGHTALAWPVIDVTDYGAVADGTTDNTTAFAAAVAAVPATGGTIYFPPAASPYVGALALSGNKRFHVTGYGAVLWAPDSGIGIDAATAHGGSSLGTMVSGLHIKGSTNKNAIGVRAINSDRILVRDVSFERLNIGYKLLTTAAGGTDGSEGCAAFHCLANNCNIGVDFDASDGSGHFDETYLVDVGINNCPTGIKLGAGVLMPRAVFDAVTIWVPSNGTMVEVNGSIDQAKWFIAGESYAGGSPCTGLKILGSAAGGTTCDLSFALRPTITTKIDVTSAPTPFGITWREGSDTYYRQTGTATTALVNSAIKYVGDTYPRVGLSGVSPANAPMPSGRAGVFFNHQGSTAPTVSLFSPAANVLQMSFATVLKTGLGATGSRPSASTVGQGAQFFDTTTNGPIWSDGTNWLEVQPLDADLTAIAALTTTTYGRSLLEAVNAAAALTTLGAPSTTDARFDRTKRIATSAPTITATANTAAKSTVMSLTIPAAEVAANDLFMFDVVWDALNNTGSAVTYQYTLDLGASQLGQTAALSVATSSARIEGRGRFYILFTDATNQRSWGEFVVSFAGAGVMSGPNTGNAGTLVSTTTESLATDKALTFSIQMGTASANADFRPIAGVLTRMR